MANTIKNKDKLLKKLKKMGNNTEMLKKGMEKATLLVQGQAKNLVPVQDGTLRASIHADVTEDGEKIIGTVSTNVEYAAFVEFGTGQVGSGTYEYSGELDFPLSYSEKDHWFYKDKNGNWHCTKGHEAQPYMYPALKYNEDKIKKLIGDSYVDEAKKG